MLVNFVTSSHNQSIFGPCCDLQKFARKTLLIDYKAVVPTSSERAAKDNGNEYRFPEFLLYANTRICHCYREV